MVDVVVIVVEVIPQYSSIFLLGTFPHPLEVKLGHKAGFGA